MHLFILFQKPFSLRTLLVIGILSTIALGSLAVRAEDSSTTTTQVNRSHWYRGALHTHSLWSDGNAYPEVVVKWYKDHDYQFVAMTDHNSVPNQTVWSNANRGGLNALLTYADQCGDWVEQRTGESGVSIRLRTMDEYRSRFEESGKFMLLPGMEITDSYAGHAVHVNGINLVKTITRRRGDSPRDVIQNNVTAIRDQESTSGQPMLAQYCHPLMDSTASADDIARVVGLDTLEIYNGNPTGGTLNNGPQDASENLWDRVLTQRLSSLNLPVVYGVGVDDAHDYQTFPSPHGNPGRGALMVRANSLNPLAIIQAIKCGNSYTTSGVKLRDVRCVNDQITVKINAEEGVQYTTRFIGTTRDYQTQLGEASLMGRTLATSTGAVATYNFTGNELYVRARIDSTKLKENGAVAGETETAWTQPMLPHQVTSDPDIMAVSCWTEY